METTTELQYSVNAVQPDDPYSSLISEFFRREFPGALTRGVESILELLTKVFFSTSQIRFGPLPSPESQVAIREVLRHRVECGEPIPVLVPWGGRKTSLERSVDIAEVSALKQLTCLQRQVQLYYSPGIQVNIRIEDAGAIYLYPEDGEAGSQAVERYSNGLQKLVRILNLSFINPIREGSLMRLDEYTARANEVESAMFDYLVETDSVGFHGDSKAWIKLQNLGWQGRIPPLQREYYYSRYHAARPGITPRESTRMLARYFAGSLARYKLNGTAIEDEWRHGGYMQISFVPPVPGAPSSLTNRTIYYRTTPERMSRTHIPAWRAMGYLRIGPDSVTPKIAGFRDHIQDIVPHWTRLSRAGEELDIETDYVVTD